MPTDCTRLWESASYYAKTQQKSLAEVAGLFDSVYVSFYKGLGAIAGGCVAAELGSVGLRCPPTALGCGNPPPTTPRRNKSPSPRWLVSLIRSTSRSIRALA